MKSGNCAKCGSVELRVRKSNGGTYGVNKIPLGRGRNAVATMDNVVCTGCGHVEFYITDPDALAKIEQSWEGL
mgnify:CR=1 FL=1